VLSLPGAANLVVTFRGIAQKSVEVSDNHLPSLLHIGDVRDGVNMERREIGRETTGCATAGFARRAHVMPIALALTGIEPAGAQICSSGE
jgi:hypothetical protein